MARRATFFGSAPVTMKPPIITLGPPSTRTRVDTLRSNFVGEGTGVGVALGPGVALDEGVGVGVGVGGGGTPAKAAARNVIALSLTVPQLAKEWLVPGMVCDQ